jgi:PAS domain S-box-containing protein
MTLLYLLYVVILTVSILISTFLMLRLWSLRTRPGAGSLIIAIIALMIWSMGYILEIVSPQLGAKIVWAKIEYLGFASLPLAIFTFAMIFSRRGEWLTRNRMMLLSVIPITTVVMALTNDWHQLIWTSIRMPEDSVIGFVVVDHSHWFYVHTAYSYTLVFFSTVFFALVAWKDRGLYRTQALIMLTGMLMPWVANITYLFLWKAFPSAGWMHIDMTPLAFLFTIIGLEVGYSRYRLADIIPVAQNTIFNSMLDGVVVLDLQSRILELNPSAAKIFQRQSYELIGQPIEKILPQWKDWVQSTRPGFQTSRELQVKNDRWNYIYSVRFETILDHDKHASGYMIFLSDTTEQKRSREQIMLQSSALEAVSSGIVITDIEGNIQWINPAFTRMTGYAPNEAIGRNIRILKSGEQSDEFYKRMWTTVTARRTWHGELINRRKDGTHFVEEMTITPLVQPDDGHISNFIAVKQDITDRKKADDELRQAHAEALEANRMKTQLLANVSHDLRTPLGGVIGYADMILNGVYGTLTPDQHKAMSEIHDSANQLLVFINNLIGQAQIDTGKIMLRPVPFEPIELVEVVQATTAMLAKKRGLELSFTIDPDMQMEIKEDMYWLRQLVLNLVSNGIKFTEKGSVTTRIYRYDQTHWAIRVADTGIGIPQEAQESIFEAFRQLDGSHTRKVSGSGLGLSIVKELTHLMGGRIELTSEVGKGSVFTIVLPLHL